MIQVFQSQFSGGSVSELARAGTRGDASPFEGRSRSDEISTAATTIGFAAITGVAPISNTDVDAMRADVLVDADRTQDARTLLAAVLQQDPKNALAQETMGVLEFRFGNLSSATKWFSEAVQLNSTSYLP
ncbi:MAG: tetratricopeptide repeat protein [Acidobacteriaceae bacterium]